MMNIGQKHRKEMPGEQNNKEKFTVENERLELTMTGENCLSRRTRGNQTGEQQNSYRVGRDFSQNRTGGCYQKAGQTKPGGGQKNVQDGGEKT